MDIHFLYASLISLISQYLKKEKKLELFENNGMTIPLKIKNPNDGDHYYPDITCRMFIESFLNKNESNIYNSYYSLVVDTKIENP